MTEALASTAGEEPYRFGECPASPEMTWKGQKRMTRAKGSSRRKRAKSDPPATARVERVEKAGVDTDHLLEEVEEANAKIADPAERERVVPSRPCEEPG